MTFANGSGTRIAIVKQSAWGAIPANPAFTIGRFTGAGLRTAKTTEVSGEMQEDLNVRDEYELGQDVSGTYDWELTYETFDDLIAGALRSAWATDVVKNARTPAYFTVEETLETGATDSFSRFESCQINQLQLDVQARRGVTGSIDWMGRKEITATAAVAGATYAAANANPVLTSNDFASFALDADSSIALTRLQLTVAANLGVRPNVSDKYSLEFRQGDCDVTGTMTAYFPNNTLYDLALAHGGGALTFKIGRGANAKYKFDMPNIVFLNPEKTRRQKNTDVMLNLPFRAKFDATLGASISVTRDAL
jgi:hypothetical protein